MNILYRYREGFGYGNHEDASFIVDEKITLNHGNNTIDLLSMMIGVQVRKKLFVNSHLCTVSSAYTNTACVTIQKFYAVITVTKSLLFSRITGRGSMLQEQESFLLFLET